MNTIALALFVLLSSGATQPVPQKVIDAAKAAKAKRKASTTRVITNDDVKKSKGKIVETELPATPVEPLPTETTMERHEAAKKAALALEQQIAEAEKKVADLQKELAALEQQYYEENDLNYRDSVLVKRFAATSAKLELAKSELAALKPGATGSQPVETKPAG
ncbi:MAG: hypothetical protein ACLGH0_09380 [Thermoanaerobaculia bacterium]